MKIDTLLPIFAPAPAGLVIAIRLNQEILSAVGVVNPGWQFVAGAVALVGCIGMIGAEMFAYKQAGLAIAERQGWAALGAFLAALACSALVVWAIGTSENTRPLISSVVIAIMAYVVLALRDFRARKKEIRQDNYDRTDKQNSQALELEKQKTKQAAAAARLAKAQVAQPQPFVNQNEHNEQPRSGGRQSLALEKVEEIRAYQKANPTKSVRDVAATCGVSVGSVSKYGTGAEAGTNVR